MAASRPDLEAIFFAARDKAPRERAAYLDEVCQGDADLRQRVERFLLAQADIGSFLESPCPQFVATVDDPNHERPGTVIGPYKLLEQIGEGGFGIVFMAEQQQPVRRKVALKVLKPGMDTRQVVARFEAERQALALMDHPNIAHVFDGGETASGRPYFVMELVRGIPITDFCDHNRFSVRQRLELFIDVCQAVQHAHQKGIIHRDLKPSNVMVTLHDDRAVVKVIDFGIAKARGHQLTDKTLFTGFAQLVGTPLYMSPEQAQMSGLDVDTRTDIYALGVLLYELLTGATPFDRERLQTAGYDEVLRILREEEPVKPSTRISTLGQAAGTVFINRQSDAKKLSQLMRGELDWVVMKALEKDRNRRYETASAFAADVQRYLRDEQVLACPPSLGYRLRKLVRRHKGAVLAVSLVVLALVVGTIGATWGMLRATSAEADAVMNANQKEAALEVSRRSEGERREQLFRALVSQARAARSSGRIGQRFEALQAIRQAAQIRTTEELRTEAMAALVLPDAEIAREWEGWPDDSFGLSFDASLHRYARLDKKGGLTICRLNAGREEVLFQLPAHGKPPFGGTWMSPDGRFVAYCHSLAPPSVFGAVRAWKVDGPEPAVLLDEPAGMHEAALAFDSTGRLLAIGHADRTISVYDLATGRRARRLTVSAAPRHLAFHPRDTRLAAACGNAVQIFDADTGRELPPLRHSPGETWTYSLAWHPDGRRLATACNDRKIHVWDTQSAIEVMPPWTGHNSKGITVAFNHAGDRLVSNDWSGQTRLWDAANGRMLLRMSGHLGMQFSPDDRLLGTGLSGNKLQFWRLVPGRELRVLRRRNADSLELIGFPVVHPNGRTVAAAGDRWLSFFDLASGEELASAPLRREDAACPVFFDPSGGWVTGGHSGLYLWPAQPGPARADVLRVGPPQQLAPDSGLGYSNGASCSRDGRVVAVPQGKSTRVLHRDHPERSVVLGPQHDVRFSAVSADGKWVVTGSHWWDGQSPSASIWDADTGKKLHDLPLEGSTQARFSPDGRWLATANSRGCQLWEAGTWREVRRMDGGTFVISPDSRLLAIADVFSMIRLVEIATGREVARLTAREPMWYGPACFTPDGARLIATCSGEQGLYVWDLRLIRQQLKELGLDWEWPELPPSSLGRPADALSKVEVLAGDLGQLALPHEQRARQAIEQGRRAVEAAPNSAKACNDLAWAYLTAPAALRDVKAALPLAEKAVRLEGSNAVYRNTLGLACYRAGRYREAVEAIRPNLESQEDWALAYDLYLLAMTHHRLGETARGRDYYELAVRWTQGRRDLSAENLEELRLLRAEAEELLRTERKKEKTGPP